MTLTLQNLTPSIGSEVRGLDLNQIDAAAGAKLASALWERHVLVFRAQTLTREAHKRVAGYFGSRGFQRHALTTLADPEVVNVQANEKSKWVAGEDWHTDVSCEAAPIRASLLYLSVVPEGGGGDTLFTNMASAYALLSDPMKGFVRTLHAVHDGALPWKTGYGIDPKPGSTYPRAEHPVVVRHPDSGNAVLYVNRGFTTHIRGLSHRESASVLELLFRHIDDAVTAQCRVKWEPGTLVMWDNIGTQHRAVWDYYPQRRYAERVSTIGVELEAAF